MILSGFGVLTSSAGTSIVFLTIMVSGTSIVLQQRGGVAHVVLQGRAHGLHAGFAHEVSRFVGQQFPLRLWRASNAPIDSRPANTANTNLFMTFSLMDKIVLFILYTYKRLYIFSMPPSKKKNQ